MCGNGVCFLTEETAELCTVRIIIGIRVDVGTCCAHGIPHKEHSQIHFKYSVGFATVFETKMCVYNYFGYFNGRQLKSSDLQWVKAFIKKTKNKPNEISFLI